MITRHSERVKTFSLDCSPCYDFFLCAFLRSRTRLSICVEFEIEALCFSDPMQKANLLLEVVNPVALLFSFWLGTTIICKTVLLSPYIIACINAIYFGGFLLWTDSKGWYPFIPILMGLEPQFRTLWAASIGSPVCLRKRSYSGHGKEVFGANIFKQDRYSGIFQDYSIIGRVNGGKNVRR